VADLRVAGALKAGSVDMSVLSSVDKNDIERKLRTEVLRGEKVVAKLDCETALEAGNRALTARGTVEVGAGSVPVSSHLDFQVRDALIVARARVRVNLPGLGITPPKGPLGAFRVDDDVEVVVRLEFLRVE